MLYIIFIKFFLLIILTFQFRSWCLLHFILIILPHVTLSAFILISSFKCFSIVPDFYMHSHLPFHMLSLFFPCALTLFTTFSELLWHLIFLCFILVMLPTYSNAVYKPMYLLSSSSVCKLMLIPSSHIFSLSLLYLLKSLSSLSLLSLSSGNYIFTKTQLWPSNLTSRLTSWLLTNSRTLV